MEHVSLAVFDYNRKKLCDIYNSSAEAAGQAKNIVLTQELGGWKELSFELPTPDFRWGYIKNDCMIRLKVGEEADWFIIQSPKTSNTGRMQTNTVKCPHISSVQKTKNLYLVLDDENGIGKIDYLINRVLTNTGWTLGECDTFYERDGETEKIRSISSSGKKGAYQQITDICNLFNAYPVYHGDSKTVDIRELTNKKPVTELFIGKNLETLNVEYKSDSIVTRLYVEGEYGEDGYVGIDDVNPTGLTFLLDFDYYRQIGLFNAGDEVALANYLSQTTGLPAVNANIKAKMAEINEGETLLNTMWGQCDYDLYFLTSAEIQRKYNGSAALNVNVTVWTAGRQYQKGDLVYGENDVVYRAQTATNSDTFNEDEWEKDIADDDQLYVFANEADTGSIAEWKAGKKYNIGELVKYDGDIYKATRTHGGTYHYTTTDIHGNTYIETEVLNPVFLAKDWEKVIILGQYRIVTGADFAEGDRYAVRFNTLPSGTIGARQVAIESKEKMIITLQGDKTKYQDVIDEETEAKEADEEELANLPEDASETTRRNLQQSIANHQIKIETYEQKIDAADEQIAAYQDSIADIYNGTEDATGLYEAMGVAVELVIHIADLRLDLIDLLERQEQIESTFAQRMGDRLKDGYWSDTNYAVGQEQLLYYDALDRMEQVSKPQVKYTVSQLMLSEYMGGEEFVPEINAKVKILDDKLEINDIAYVSKRVQYLDDPRKGSIEISTEDLISATSKSFEVVMSKVTQMADVVNQRNSLYERAQAINANGTLPVDKISGTINIQQSNITSPKSTWYTDEAGAMIFESVLGDSAYKIGGDGFMIATSKLDGENWDWRLFGDGFGFDASALTSGVLNSDVIADGSVGSGKLGGSVGRDLNIEENKTIIAHNDQMHAAGLELSPEGIWAYAVDNTTGLGSKFSEIKQTSEEIRAEVQDYYEGLGTYISVTAGGLRSEINDYYDGLRNYITVTAGGLKSELNDYYDGLRNYIVATAGGLYSELNDYYDGLRNYITVTAEGLNAELNDYYDGLRNYITVTANGLYSEQNDYYNGLASYVSVTAGELKSEVNNYYTGLSSRIQQNSSSIGLVVKNGKVDAGSIILAINGAGKSSTVIESDRISLNGLTMAQNTAAKSIYSQSINTDALKIYDEGTFQFGAYTITTKTLNMNNTWSVGTVLGGGIGDAQLNINHYHKVTFDNTNGTITLGEVTNTQPSPFSVADTTWYKNKVSAIKTAVSDALGNGGWTDSSGATTVIQASLDTTNKVVKINSATARISYPGDANPTTVNIGLGNQDVSSALNTYANSIDLTSDGWINGTNVVKTTAPTPKTYTVNLPAFQTSGGATFTNHKTTVTFSTQSVQTPLKSVVVDATNEYETGKTDGKGLMGVAVDIEDMIVKAAESSTKSQAVSCTQSDLAYNATSHKYSTTSTTKIGGSTIWTATKYSTDKAYTDGVTDGRPSSLSKVTLGSSDTGSSVSKTVTVTCADSTTVSKDITIDASAVYNQGKSDGTTTGYTGLTVNTTTGTISVSSDSTSTSATVAAGTITSSETATAGLNSLYCPITLNGTTIGYATGSVQVYQNQYKTCYPHARVAIGGEVKTISFPGQYVYCTYTYTPPAGNYHYYKFGYMYTSKSTSSRTDTQAYWYYSTDGSKPPASIIGREYGYCQLYDGYERNTWYVANSSVNGGWVYWFACSSRA